jgi:hypothetical protein
MPNTGFLGWAYVSGSTVSFSSGGAGSLDVGAQVYADPTVNGGFTSVRPSTVGHVVRVVGQAVDDTVIYFNPSPDYIEL